MPFFLSNILISMSEQITLDLYQGNDLPQQNTPTSRVQVLAIERQWELKRCLKVARAQVLEIERQWELKRCLNAARARERDLL